MKFVDIEIICGQQIKNGNCDRNNLRMDGNNWEKEIGALLGERVFSAIAKSIDQYQPVQSAQADMGRNFSLSLHFLPCQRNILNYDFVSSLT